MDEPFDEMMLNGVAGLIDRARARNILTGFVGTGWDADRLAGLDRLLGRARARRLFRFDPYLECGWRPKECALSHAIAQLLNPSGRHGLGASALDEVLATVEKLRPASVGNIRGALRSDPRYLVRREYPAAISRPDICIIGSSFVIFIENKKYGGTETIAGGRSQSERQAQVLQEFAEARGISGANTLGIFLSPEGNQPRAASYVPLSVHSLAQAVRRALGNAATDDVTAAPVRAFLCSYENLT